MLTILLNAILTVHRKPLRIIDNQGRVIVYIVGHPEEFDKVSKETIEAFERVEKLLSLNAAHTHHRRGEYGFVSTSISFSGGQMRPGNLRNTVNNESVMEELLSNWAVQRVVQFINKAFAAVHPELWKRYWCLLDDLTDAHPYLSWIFDHEHSVFASCTLNIGGMTTHRHRDHLNLGLGVCPIFAIEDFDHTKGGHLVLWDLKLVIEFPLGTLILIPSVLLEHSNVPIREGETHYSFTQFSAAGLFRWVDNGYCSDKDLEEWGSWVEGIAGEHRREKIWEEGFTSLGHI
ncbi:hypothetical protein ARMGADRAFT_949646 [Armillaria gallica]|uniref:2OGFeDO JBP1/TET oxygenase domain-containing protein n=1 Tax=Armillaria gallica TaxID=47427 RepID=A0A2H3CUP3_ARMGA|nr:hypothetical protein ARMGADRAFT_949646 [Armillaria gallica]